jgi:hypothetical protein
VPDQQQRRRLFELCRSREHACLQRTRGPLRRRDPCRIRHHSRGNKLRFPAESAFVHRKLHRSGVIGVTGAAFPTGGGCIDAGYQNAVGAGQFQVKMAPCTAPLWSPQAGVGGAFLVTIANVLNNPPICYIASLDNLCGPPTTNPGTTTIITAANASTMATVTPGPGAFSQNATARSPICAQPQRS